MKQTTYIAIDIGTSFIKGGLLDLAQYRLHQIRRVPFPDPLPGGPPLHYAVDPRSVAQAVEGLIAELLQAEPACDGLVLCSQMHGLVLMNERGEPLSDAITWRDQRALQPHPSGQGSTFDVLLAHLSPTERQELGNGLRAGLPICTLFWWATREPDRLEGAIPATLPDFVLTHLCAASQPAGVEPTNAAAHGVFNVARGDWHWPVIERLGLNRLQWPTVRQVNEPIGVLRRGQRELTCYAPVGDHQCALAGTLLETGELSLNISTGSQVSLVTPNVRFGPYEIRPYFDDRYLNTVVQIPAGRALDGLVDLLTELARGQGVTLSDPWPYIADATAAVEQTDLDVNLSFFASALGSHGHIDNMREDNMSVGHLFRAAFQSMAATYHAYAQHLSPEQTWSRLVFSGGLAQKQETLRQLIVQTFDCDYRLTASTEDTLLGLLTLALFASGETESVAQAADLVRQANEH